MASINGIEIKGMKTFKGHEGEPCLQGNVYYNGKKMGFWSQDARGGCDSYDFNTAELDDAVESYKESDRVEEKYRKFFDLDGLLNDLTAVMDMEKAYKKFVKDGFLTTAVVTDGYHQFYIGHRSDDKEVAERGLEKTIEECKGKCFKNEKISVHLFNSPEDFVISTQAPVIAKKRGR